VQCAYQCCACINFKSFGSTRIPGSPFAVNGFYFDFNKYYAFSSSTQLHEYKLYFKITLNASADQDPAYDSVWYEGYLPWEEPLLASCSSNYPFIISWGNDAFNWCNTNVKIVAKKVFRQPLLTSAWTVAAETEGEFFYSNSNPNSRPCW
jgi:hypothetical protein